MTSRVTKIGIEEEFFVVSSRSGLIVKKLPAGMYTQLERAFGDAVAHEAKVNQIELRSGPFLTPSELREDVILFRKTLMRIARHSGVEIAAVGAHPISKWEDTLRTPCHRYFRIENELQIALKRWLTCGTHFHVEALSSEDKLLKYRTMRVIAPLFLALSCSSPIWRGHNTGLKSYRSCIMKEVPRSGTPPEYASYEDYLDDLKRLIESENFLDGKDIWWDVRFNSHHSTVEMRICDQFLRPERTAAAGGLLLRIIESISDHSKWPFDQFLESSLVIDHNKWQAARRGMEAVFVTKNGQIPFKHILAEIMDRVLNPAKDASIVDELLNGGDDAAKVSDAFATGRLHDLWCFN